MCPGVTLGKGLCSEKPEPCEGSKVRKNQRHSCLQTKTGLVPAGFWSPPATLCNVQPARLNLVGSPGPRACPHHTHHGNQPPQASPLGEAPSPLHIALGCEFLPSTPRGGPALSSGSIAHRPRLTNHVLAHVGHGVELLLADLTRELLLRVAVYNLIVLVEGPELLKSFATCHTLWGERTLGPGS